MKVADVMSTSIDFVSSDTSVNDVARIIFGRGINGVPVCRDGKLIGFITERDILAKFYPSVQEFVEDQVHAGNFEEMEKKVHEILSLKAEDIMSKNPVSVTPETLLLRAQSLMFVKKVGRLPVVDKKGHLIGVLTKGDVFRAAVGDWLSKDTDEEYHDWLSRHYDLLTGWRERLNHETPDLTSLFKKEQIKTIIDIGSGTGEHDFSLAEKGFRVLAIEQSKLMCRTSAKKKDKKSKEVKERIQFVCGNYNDILNSQKEKYDAVIFMGNAFPHLAHSHKEIFSSVSKALKEKNAIVVMQIINFEKVFKVKKRFLDFNFNRSKNSSIIEKGFLEFYDPPRENKKTLTLNMFIFDFDGKNWRAKSKNSTKIAYLKKENIEKLLKDEGFKKVEFYGGMFNGSLFKSPFKPLESDWLNVVAKR